MRGKRFQPRRKWGQHFLRDKGVLRRMVEYAEVGPKDVVMEIGPGPGALTEMLAGEAKKVVAIEVDRQFERRLREIKKRYGNLEIIWGDAKRIRLPRFDKVVANLPYKEALPVIFRILQKKFSRAVLTCQLSLAQRIVSQKGSRGYGRVSVLVQSRAEAEIMELVSKKAFSPKPEVENAIIRLTSKKKRMAVPESQLGVVLDFLFLGGEKTVGRSLEPFWERSDREDRKRISHLFRRGVRDLEAKDYVKVAEFLYKNGVRLPRFSRGEKRRIQQIRKINRKKRGGWRNPSR